MTKESVKCFARTVSLYFFETTISLYVFRQLFRKLLVNRPSFQEKRAFETLYVQELERGLSNRL